MKKIIASLLLLGLVLTGCAAQSPREEVDYLTVHYIDVGQADCILLLAGDTAVLIDGGNTDTSAEVVSYLRRYGVKDVDLMVNTHPHGDHIGGLPAVLSGFPVETVWTSTLNYDSYTFDRFMNLAREQDAKIEIPTPGTVYQEDGLLLTVLGPVGTNYEDLNDTSLVLMAQFGEKKFLFTGDMESVAENHLLTSQVSLKADVLKVGHHGSYSSTSAPFLKAVDPDYAVISCGRDNEYGHPHPGPMKELKNQNVEVFRTDLMGSVTIMTDGKKLSFLLEYPAAMPNAA